MTNQQSHDDGTLSDDGLHWLEDAEAALEEGATVVAVGRAAIANPCWATRAASPEWQPRRPPLTVAELRERGLSERFANYMRDWPGFVAA